MSEVPRFKIGVIGSAGVGKSTFIHRHRTGEFVREYRPTLGVEVNPLSFRLSDRSDIVFTMWDVAGQEQHKGMGEEYLSGTDAIIIMFDVTSVDSFNAAIKVYYPMAKKWCPNGHILVIGSKVDVQRTVSKEEIIKVFSNNGIKYCDVSSKNNTNIDNPFLYLARCLKRDNSLTFIEKEALLPPQVIPAPGQLRVTFPPLPLIGMVAAKK